MNIKFDLLFKAVIDVVKYPVAGMLGAGLIIGVASTCFALFGWYAPVVMGMLFVLGLLIFLVVSLYKSLVDERLRQEQNLINTLRK